MAQRVTTDNDQSVNEPSISDLLAVSRRERPTGRGWRIPAVGDTNYALACWGVMHPRGFVCANVAFYSILSAIVLTTPAPVAFKLLVVTMCTVIAPAINYGTTIPVMRRFVAERFSSDDV